MCITIQGAIYNKEVRYLLNLFVIKFCTLFFFVRKSVTLQQIKILTLLASGYHQTERAFQVEPFS